MRLRLGFAILGIIALAGSVIAQVPVPGLPPAGGQGGDSGPVLKNLQFFPKDTSPAEVFKRMDQVAQALGVQCYFCHQIEGLTRSGSASNDLSLDTKPTKVLARAMMRMTVEINRKLAADIKKPVDQLTQVDCVTCHRGRRIPTAPSETVPQSACAAVLIRARDTCR